MIRYVFERYGWSYGVMSMQGGEKYNGEMRSDLSSSGNNNNHRSYEHVSTDQRST